MIKKAFTITELLIALGVIAVLTAIMLPIVHQMIPEQNTLMAKRAFYTTETIVSSMINNEGCYPPILSLEGFEDGKGYKRCSEWGINASNSAKDKFIYLFTQKLDIKENIAQTEEKPASFKTKDGMYWEFKSVDFNSGSGAILMVDVDGKYHGPNCGQNSQSGTCSDKNRNKGFDTFSMQILKDGKIQILDNWAIDAAKIDKKLIGTNK